jgi:L-threonylcarbamoyladenylate synthase
MNSPAHVSAGVQTGISKLRNGGVIAFPTDTLYALAADATNDDAVRRVYQNKGREDGKPLPLLVSDLAMAREVAELSPAAISLAARFWPGGLTMVLRRKAGFDSLALAGGDTVALRAPDHPIARAIIAGLGRPVTGTSANRSGGPDPVTADDVRRELEGQVDFVVDGGACPTAQPSTIVNCTADPPSVLREGAVSAEAVREALEAPASR